MRSFGFTACFLIFMSAFPGWLAAQTTPTPTTGPTATSSQPAPVRDQTAVTAIQAAIASMGGAVQVATIQDSTIQGTVQDQSNDSSPTQNFVWMTSGIEFRTQVSTPASTRIYVSGHGSPVDQENGINTAIPNFVAQANLPYQLPATVLLNELNNSNYTISYVGPASVNGQQVVHIHTCDNTSYASYLVTPQEWYFDSISGLPTRVEYKLPRASDAQSSFPQSIDFGSYEGVNGVLVPFHLALNQRTFAQVATIESVAFNTGLSATEFDRPSGIQQ